MIVLNRALFRSMLLWVSWSAISCAAPVPIPSEIAPIMCAAGAGTRAELRHALVNPRYEVAPTLQAQPEPAPQVNDGPVDVAVLLSIDGLRPDVIGYLTPTLRQLQRTGASARRAYTISHSTTLPSHASMVSGVDIDRHGLDFNAYRPSRGRTRAPTIFTAAHHAGIPTSMFVGKQKLELIAATKDVDVFEVRSGHCAKVADKAAKHIHQLRKGLVFIHFADTDSAGHQYGWMSAPYKQAVREIDRCTAIIYRALSKHSNSLMVVTADHGGHDRNHGSGSEIDRHIPWLAVGAQVKARTTIDRFVSTKDTAATMLFSLGLADWQSFEGKPVADAFVSEAEDTVAERSATNADATAL